MAQGTRPPTRAEVVALVEGDGNHRGLKAEWSVARKELRHWKPTQWEFAVPAIKRLCWAILTDRKLRISAPMRQAVQAFAADHGTEARNAVAAEALVVRQNIRFSANQWDRVIEAAAKAGLEPSAWVRVAAVEAADRDLRGDDDDDT